jgi:hypothetical protein
MDQEPDVIQREIEDTRHSLTEKLETLENQVRGTVESAKTTVEDTIANVRASVHETVDTVKRTFDIKYQVCRHPFGCLAATLASGFVIGYFIGGPRRRESAGPPIPRSDSPSLPEPLASRMGSMATLRPSGVAPVLQSESSPAQESTGSHFLGKFDSELHKVKELAIGALMGLVRDMAKQSLPPAIAPHVEQIMDSATSKMGGQPLESPVVSLSKGNGWHSTSEC